MTEIPFAVVVRTDPAIVKDDSRRKALEMRVKATIGPNCPPVLVVSRDDDVELLTVTRDEGAGEWWKREGGTNDAL